MEADKSKVGRPLRTQAVGLSSVCVAAENTNNLSPVGPVTTAIGRNCSQRRTLLLELASSPC